MIRAEADVIKSCAEISGHLSGVFSGHVASAGFRDRGLGQVLNNERLHTMLSTLSTCDTSSLSHSHDI